MGELGFPPDGPPLQTDNEGLWKVMEMKEKKPTKHLWTVLGAVNVLAPTYPINLFHRANSVDETLYAALVLMGSVFLLVVVDTVSVVLQM